MDWRAGCCLVVAAAGGWTTAAAQISDSAAAAAVGVYQAPPPAETETEDSATGPAVLPDSVPGAGAVPEADPGPLPASVQDVAPLDSVPPPADTSLTYRLDARRGGGLSRGEFPDLRAVAAGAGRYEIFLELVAEAGAAPILAGDSLVTVLAPTDSAFAGLPADVRSRLRSDPPYLQAWLDQTVFPGNRAGRELLEAGALRSPGGTAVRFARGSDGWIHAGPARVVQLDLFARNGVLHGVDRVILPETTSAAP